MLIRQEQMNTFREYMRGQFVTRMQQYLRATFPNQTKPLDDTGLRKLIVTCTERAESYGIEFQDDIQRYLAYALLLSEDFDSNPHTSWAGDILRGNGSGGQKMSRIDKLYLFSRKRKA